MSMGEPTRDVSARDMLWIEPLIVKSLLPVSRRVSRRITESVENDMSRCVSEVRAGYSGV